MHSMPMPRNAALFVFARRVVAALVLGLLLPGAASAAIPTITSATYDASTGTLVVTGTDFVSKAGADNDIVAEKLTLVGAGGAGWTLFNSSDVDITSSTSFTIVVDSIDRSAVDLRIDANGTAAADGTPYNLVANEDWAAGADPAVVVADTTGNGITASNVKATPVIVTTSGATPYVADTPVVIDAGLTVSDADSSTLVGAWVLADGDPQNELAFTNDGSTMGNIMRVPGTARGTLQLISPGGGTASVVQWQAALRSVTLMHPSSAGNAPVSVRFRISDGTRYSTDATKILVDHGAPSVTTAAGSTSFIAGDNTASTPVVVDSGVSVTGATVVSATVGITGGFHAGEDVLAFANDGSTMGNITGSYNAATGVLMLTSAGATATLPQWQAALRSATYTDTAVTPDTATRTVSFTVTDGTNDSTATRTVTVTAVDQTPVVATAGGTVDYESGTAGVTIDNGVMVSDLDSTTQSSATVSISTGLDAGDVLAFVNTNGALFGNIIGSYNAATGVLSLTSNAATATNAQWSTALSAVVFSSTSTTPGSRTIAYAVSDGVKISATATNTVYLVGAPEVTGVSSITTDGNYMVGDTIQLAVAFDRAVVVDITGGTPALQLETGIVDRSAAYVSGSGSDTLVFAYTVQADDSSEDLDYTSTAALALGGGSIRSSGGLDAVLTLPPVGGADSIAGRHAIVVDGVAPSVATVAVPADGTYLPGQNLDFTVHYTEPVAVDTTGGTPRIAMSLDTGGTVYADYVSGSGTSALRFRHAVVVGEVDPDGIVLVNLLDANGGTLRDAAGNAAGQTLNGIAPTSGVLIGPAGQTITFGAQSTQTFVAGGTFALDPLATASSGLPVAYSSQTTSVCTVSGSTVTMLAAGTCTIAADQAGNASYGAAPTVTQSIGIGAGDQVISFGAQAAQVFVPDGTFVLDPPATASSGLPVSYGSQTTDVCTIDDGTVTMLAAGTCTIAADQAGDANYNPAPTVTQSIAIDKATQAITGFASNPEAPTFAPNGTFGVSAQGGGSGNPVVFASTTGAVCTVSGDVVTMLAAGLCSLTADQAGNDNYGAAPQQVLDVAIARATPTLAWIDALEKVVGEPAFELPDPESDSDGTFAFSSSDPSVATVDGNRVTIVGPGAATLVAVQAATRDYAEATIGTPLTVAARPDPTRDAEVVGTIQAQVDASLRFVAAQQQNIAGRLRQLRASRGNPSSNALSLGYLGTGGGLAMPVGGDAVGARLMPSGMWVAGTITVSKRDATADSDKVRVHSDGVTVGFDHAMGDRLVFGVAGGYGWSDADSGSDSTLEGSQRSMAAYALWRGGRNLFVDGMLGIGELRFDIARWSEAAGATARARRDGEQRFATLTFGYEHAGEHVALTGYGRYETSRTTLDPYAESGLGAYDLRYGEQAIDDSALAVGFEGRYDFATPTMDWRPYWLVEYRGSLQGRSDVGINYVLQPVGSDYVLGMRNTFAEALSMGAGLDLALPRGWQLGFQFRREQSDSGSADSYGMQLKWGGSGALMPGVGLFDPMDGQDPMAEWNAMGAR